MAVKKEKELVPYTDAKQTITVIDPKVNLFPAKVRRRGNRFKCWQILMTMDGKSVSEYFAACRAAGIADGGGCSANNVRDAINKAGIITVSPVPKS